MAAARRDSFSPAALASLAAHGALLAAAAFYWPQVVKPLTIGSVVPVGIVAEGPPDVRPALLSPDPAEAATLEPEPDAPVPPAAATPAETPSPAPAAPAKTVAPAKGKTTAAAPGLDLDALASALTGGGSTGGGRRSSAPQGPARPETAVQARPPVGAATGLSSSAMADLASPLERLWNPNCEVEGGANVDLVVGAVIGANGYLVGQPQVIKGVTADPITQAAATRALSAVRRAEPFRVPADFRQQAINFRLNARTACARVGR